MKRSNRILGPRGRGHLSLLNAQFFEQPPTRGLLNPAFYLVTRSIGMHEMAGIDGALDALEPDATGDGAGLRHRAVDALPDFNRLIGKIPHGSGSNRRDLSVYVPVFRQPSMPPCIHGRIFEDYVRHSWNNCCLEAP